MAFNLKNRIRRKLYSFHGKVFLSSYKGTKFHCNICDQSFDKMIKLYDSYTIRGKDSDHSLPNAICPNCGSWFRHRMLQKYIDDSGFLEGQPKLLHFAPETFFVKNFEKKLGNNYHTCDLKVMESPNHHIVDINNIPFEDNSFDRIICSHVLEHIETDEKAISELYRILKPGGIALIAVPTYGDKTEEDLSLTPAQRKLEYGINIHVRLYGTDISKKLEKAGFKVQMESYDTIEGNYMERGHRSAHLDSDKYIFICTK